MPRFAMMMNTSSTIGLSRHKARMRPGGLNGFLSELMLRYSWQTRLSSYGLLLKRRALRRVLLVMGIALTFVTMEMWMAVSQYSQEPVMVQSRTSSLFRFHLAFSRQESILDVGQRAPDNHIIRERFPLWVSNGNPTQAKTMEPRPKMIESTPKMIEPESQRTKRSFHRLLTMGHSIKLPSLDVHIPTAVRYEDFPEKGAFNVLLNGWARDAAQSKFVCCFLYSLQYDFGRHKPYQVKATPYRINSDSSTTIQSAEFYCSAPKSEIRSSGYFSNFKYVALSESNCTRSSPDVIRIDFPEKTAMSVGVCAPVPRRPLDPEFLVEWLEWHRLQGVTEVYVYHDRPLNTSVLRVFEYYVTIEFVKLFNVQRPEHAVQDDYSDVMMTNDCKHRMSQFDYVISLDIDEILAPRKDTQDIYHILKNASTYYPKPAAFQIHSFQVVLDWKPSKRSPLHLARHQVHHAHINLGQDKLYARWAFIPHRVTVASKQHTAPMENFSLASIPPSILALLRFRKCPPQLLNGCLVSSMGVKEEIISRFQVLLIVNMRQLPLEYILPNNLGYARSFDQVEVPGDWSYYGQRENLTALDG